MTYKLIRDRSTKEKDAWWDAVLIAAKTALTLTWGKCRDVTEPIKEEAGICGYARPGEWWCHCGGGPCQRRGDNKGLKLK